MKCLWITLADPEPATNGQLIYSKGANRSGLRCWRLSHGDRFGAASDQAATDRSIRHRLAARTGAAKIIVASPDCARSGCSGPRGAGDGPGARAGTHRAIVGCCRIRQYLCGVGSGSGPAPPAAEHATATHRLCCTQSRDHSGTARCTRRSWFETAVERDRSDEGDRAGAAVDRLGRFADFQHPG